MPTYQNFTDFWGNTVGEVLSFTGGPWEAISLGFNLFQAGQLYKEERQRGAGKITAFGAAALQTAAFEIFPALAWASLAANVIPVGFQAYNAAAERRKSWWDDLRYPNMGVYFDTSAALTMRQAAVQAIQQSKLNARSVLGQEARLMAGG